MGKSVAGMWNFPNLKISESVQIYHLIQVSLKINLSRGSQEGITQALSRKAKKLGPLLGVCKKSTQLPIRKIFNDL